MELKRLLLTGLALAALVTLRAQNVSDLIIAEALVEADSTGIVDDFGQRDGWIELYGDHFVTLHPESRAEVGWRKWRTSCAWQWTSLPCSTKSGSFFI